jgi:hypothetical protein
MSFPGFVTRGPAESSLLFQVPFQVGDLEHAHLKES